MAAKKVSLRSAILLVIIFLFFSSILYKYLEWRVIKDFVQLQGVTIPRELSMVESNDKQNDAVAPILDKLNSEKTKIQDRLLIYDELVGKANLLIDASKEYKRVLQENKNKYQQYKLISRLFIGDRGKLFKSMIDNQLSYYDNEIKSAEQGIVEDYLVMDIFIVSKDKGIMTLYDTKASISPNTLYSKYYSEIASLEKYTHEDYKLPEESTIKEYYPYGYETLQNNKEYLGSYYSVIKDYVSEDYESANYKYKKLQGQNLKLNVDMDRLINEGDLQKQELLKTIVGNIVAKNSAILAFKKSNFGSYPLLRQISGWKNDLEMCQIYLIKGSLLAELSKKPNEATSLDEYLASIDQITPSTVEINKDFDKSIMKFINEEKKLTIQCEDKENQTLYEFTLTK